MHGLISGIKRMEIHDGDGLRTTVFFKGCPLKCIWCHNPESISFNRQITVINSKCVYCKSCEKICKNNAIDYFNNKISIDFLKCNNCLECVNLCPTAAIDFYGKEYSSDELVDYLMQDELFFKNGNGGVTLSGGECLAQGDFATEVAKKLKEKEISVYIDTCGYVNRQILKDILPYSDKFLYDIKAIDKDVHIKCTGKDNEIILSNLEFLSNNGAKIEIRYPLVVGYNDTECIKIAEYLTKIKGIEKIKVLKYHSYAGSRYESLGMENTLPKTETKNENIENAVNILKSFNLNAINGEIDN